MRDLDHQTRGPKLCVILAELAALCCQAVIELQGRNPGREAYDDMAGDLAAARAVVAGIRDRLAATLRKG